MKQDYITNKNLEIGPRPIVIQRILAFSKSYKSEKRDFRTIEKD
jgi:hypothetical protein